MNWDAVGALAELAGAAGVVITLAYLAVQISQTGKQTAASAADSARGAVNEVARILATDAEAARIYRLGLEDRASLSLDEAIRFDSICYLQFNAMQEWHRQGISIAETSRRVLTVPALAQYWEANSIHFSEDFRQEVSRLMAQFQPARHRATADSAAAENASAAAQQSAAADTS